jgi:hypothetical protein
LRRVALRCKMATNKILRLVRLPISPLPQMVDMVCLFNCATVLEPAPDLSARGSPPSLRVTSKTKPSQIRIKKTNARKAVLLARAGLG